MEVPVSNHSDPWCPSRLGPGVAGMTLRSRTLRTEVDLDNADGKLRPGMYAHARLKVAERADALALPRGAVLMADGKTHCFTIKREGDHEGEIVRTPIETGIRAGDEIEIVSGLSGDEQIIGVNATAFREGQHVEVAEPKSGS